MTIRGSLQAVLWSMVSDATQPLQDTNVGYSDKDPLGSHAESLGLNTDEKGSSPALTVG